jgi:hypothetical protein
MFTVGFMCPSSNNTVCLFALHLIAGLTGLNTAGFQTFLAVMKYELWRSPGENLDTQCHTPEADSN